MLLTTEQVGHSTVYAIAQQEDNLEKYEIIDKDVLRVFSTVRYLQQKPVEPVELYQGLNIDFCNPDSVEEPVLDVGRTQFDKLLRGMLASGMLIQAGKRKKLYPSGETVPIILELEEDGFWSLYDELEKVPKGYPYYKALASIHTRMDMLLGNACEAEQEYQHTYGRKFVNFENLNAILQRVPLQQCFTNIARFSYGGKRDLYLAAGLIVYCADKDKLYLLGRQASAKGQLQAGYEILKLDKLEKVEAIDVPNELWQAAEFKALSRAMFSISVAQPVNVKVEFEDVFNIKAKLQGLLSQRRSAKLTKQGNKLLYEDLVAGLPDLANYLRQYGSSCRVLEPQALIDIMKQGVLRGLERYKEAGYGEEL